MKNSVKKGAATRPSRSEVRLRTDAVPERGRLKKLPFCVSKITSVLLLICLIGAGNAFGFLQVVSVVRAVDTSAIPESFNVNDYLQIKDKDKKPQQNTYVPGKDTPATQQTGIIGFLTRVIDLFIRLIATVSFLVFIVGAIYTLVSQGKSDQLEKGKTAMIYAVIGLIISLMAFVIVTFVQSVLF